jgi:Flp pilus assembly protein TadD
MQGAQTMTGTAPAAAGTEARYRNALALFHAGKLHKAEALCGQILRRRPRHGGALQILGLAARRAGRLERALQLLHKAAAAAPDRPEIHCDLGNALKAAGRFEEALDHHRRALELAPDAPETLSNIGVTYRQWGRAGEAVWWLSRAAELRPGDAEILFNLGNALLSADRFDDAAANLARACEFAPNHVGARTSLGVALKEAGRLDAAIDTLQDAIILRPDHPDAHWNLALALLADGRYRQGWREYEWRRRLPDFAIRRFPLPPWDGAPLAGRRLLVHAEQGLGDSIQFLRYLGALGDGGGGDVVFLCQPGLADLLGGAPGLPRLIHDAAQAPDCEVEAPLLSLPWLLGGEAPCWPPGKAYLAADPERAAAWRARLGPEIRIGLAWQGNPDYAADRRRSIPLATLAPIVAAAPGAIVSLQRGPGAEQHGEVSFAAGLRDPGTDFDAARDKGGAFVDSAAILAGLDLLITSDSALAHLGGALGTEVWLLLPEPADWRWGRDAETTPWYPSMRLFRQHRAGEWSGPVRRVAEALARRRAGWS